MLLLRLFTQSFDNFGKCRGENIEENVVLRFVELEDLRGDGRLVTTKYGSILHELKEPRLCDFVLVEDIEDLKYELQVFLLLHVDKVFHDLVVRANEDRHREVIETWRQNICHLVCYRLLVALFKELTQLNCISETLLRGDLVEMALQVWILVDLETNLFASPAIRRLNHNFLAHLAGGSSHTPAAHVALVVGVGTAATTASVGIGVRCRSIIVRLSLGHLWHR